jgi:hypothetical protein
MNIYAREEALKEPHFMSTKCATLLSHTFRFRNSDNSELTSCHTGRHMFHSPHRNRFSDTTSKELIGHGNTKHKDETSERTSVLLQRDAPTNAEVVLAYRTSTRRSLPWWPVQAVSSRQPIFSSNSTTLHKNINKHAPEYSTWSLGS